MMAVLMDRALDLSRRPCTTTTLGRAATISTGLAESPTPSFSSDTDSQQALDHGLDRSESVSSDGHETDSSTGPGVKPVAISPSSASSSSSLPAAAAATTSSLNLADAMNDSSAAGSVRPFKLYSMDPTVGGMYQSQVAPSPSLSPGLGAGPLTPGATLGPLGLVDPLGLSCSPIAQYLQQRKRRAERSSLPRTNVKQTRVVPEEHKDAHYWERRRKNNDAAKRSRDARRIKEEEIAMRAAFLEQENLKLRAQVAILKNETAKLHFMLYNRI